MLMQGLKQPVMPLIARTFALMFLWGLLSPLLKKIIPLESAHSAEECLTHHVRIYQEIKRLDLPLLISIRSQNILNLNVNLL